MALRPKLVNHSLKVAAIAAAFVPGIAHGLDCTPTVTGGTECAKGNLTGTLLTQNVTNIVNTVIFATGIVAVILIIVGGIRYTVSQGDEKSVQGAKNTILYAVIGLVIALLAFAIVNFVLAGLSTGKPA